MKTRVFALALLAIPAFAAGNDNDDKAKDDYKYLALGDSVAFGLDVTKLFAGPSFPPANVHKGYPEVLAEVVRAKHVNTSCPGETSASFLDSAKPDNGCNSPHLDPPAPPFKIIGLHTPYTGAQQDFAISQIKSNKDISLITLGIGGNDILLIVQECSKPGAGDFTTCVNAMRPAVLREYEFNLTQILEGLRKKYKGTLVVMKYYSPFAFLDQSLKELNEKMEKVGPQFGVKFADGWTAFRIASARHQGDPCKAGLLVRFPDDTCDVHPSLLGQQILAASVGLALLH